MSLPEKHLFGVFSSLQYLWTLVANVITFYIHSNTLYLLMNAVVHVKAFKFGLVSRVYSYAASSLEVSNLLESSS